MSSSPKRINLFFLSKCLYGGWRVYTSHLWHSLKKAGWVPQLYMIGGKDEHFQRKFHYSGVTYKNCTEETASRLVQDTPGLVVVFDKNFTSQMVALHAHGAGIMLHDEDEVVKTIYARDYILSALELNHHRILTGRHNSLYERGAHCVPYPYYTGGIQFLDDSLKRKVRCITISRIDNDKRTEMFFDANRLLTRDKQIEIRGYDGRVYGRKFLKLHYPEYKMSSYQFPKEDLHGGAGLCATAQFSADMSRITGNGAGGDTQYTFLESMHANTPLIIHDDWLRPGGEMVKDVNCLTVENAEDLSDILRSGIDSEKRQALIEGGNELLWKHRPERVSSILESEIRQW